MTVDDLRAFLRDLDGDIEVVASADSYHGTDWFAGGARMADPKDLWVSSEVMGKSRDDWVVVLGCED